MTDREKEFRFWLRVALIATVFVIGLIIGKSSAESDGYLSVVYARGQKSVIDTLENMFKFYEQDLTSDEGNVVTQVISGDYENVILWAKHRDGKLIIDKCRTYDDVPIN